VRSSRIRSGVLFGSCCGRDAQNELLWGVVTKL